MFDNIVPKEEPFYDLVQTPPEVQSFVNMLYQPAQDLADLVGKPIDQSVYVFGSTFALVAGLTMKQL